MASGAPSETSKLQANAQADSQSLASFNIKNTTINDGVGAHLSKEQKLLVGSVLDLFEGRPTLKLLSLWSENATFSDPLSISEGYNKFAAQWYGLPALFSPIQIQSHKVTSAGNPIELDLSNKYVVKGIKKEQIINSKVLIHVGSDGKITKVEDKWNGSLPEGVIAQTFRKLNAVVVPAIVKVPKTEEEDKQMQAERGE